MATNHLLWLVISVLMMALRAMADGTCTFMGYQVPAPEVVTVMAAPNDTENGAWIVQPNCSIEAIALFPANNGRPMLNCSDKNIGAVTSLPSLVERLDLENNPPITTEVNLMNYTKLGQLILAWSSLTRIDNFKLPTSLYTLDLDGNQMQGIAEGTIPGTLNTIYVTRNGLKSLDNFSFPSTLASLNLHNNSLTSVNFTIPSGLSELHLDGNKLIKNMENFTMPNALTSFTCAYCAVETFRGVQLSRKLGTLDLSGSVLKEFEIEDMDVVTLGRVTFSGNVTQPKCTDPRAQLSDVLPSVPTCVITASVFGSKYLGLPLVSTTPSPTNSSTSSSSSSKTTIIVIVSVVAVLVVLVVIVIIRRRCGKRSGDKDKYQDASTMEMQSSSGPGGSSIPEYLANDIRTDETLIARRIAFSDIELTRVIGKGGYGIIHLGKFRGREVAVKQILPERAKDLRVVRSFMDEIRLCATLEHPRIVEFVGLMWSSLQDMAVVCEYMAGGDLRAVLEKQPSPSNPADWFTASPSLKAKGSVALDVIVALVYLHSFNLPIIHRDLKARNVLLTAEGDAKLSDFGISREVVLDETMTGEIGTVAWIAPEVLRGERYSEKADIYSLGVLLVELDTARHPYQREISDSTMTPHGNTRIALLVSSGRLTPAVSTDSPSEVAALIQSCLSYDPQHRPSAMAVHYEFRKLIRVQKR